MGSFASILFLSSVLLVLPPVWAGDASPRVWESRGAGGGGALFSPRFNPHRPGELFVACDMSELFRGFDDGTGWELVDFRQIQGNRDCAVQFSSLSNLMYALDYSTVAGADLRRPTRSLDGGVTWQPLVGDPTSGEAYGIWADPTSTNRLLTADYNTLYSSTNGGATFAPVFSTADPNGLWVAGSHFAGSWVLVGTSQGLLQSTNGGAAFALSGAAGYPAGLEIASLTGATQGGTTRVVAVMMADGALYPGMLIEDVYGNPDYRGIYRLDVGAGGWVLCTNGVGAGHRPLFVSMCRTNVQTVYAAGQRDDDYPAVYRSDNGGDNWQLVLTPANNANVQTGWCGAQGDRDYTYDAYYVGFSVSPLDIRRAALTGYGFLHVTTNGGVSWQAAYVQPADRNPAGINTPRGRAYRGIGLENTTSWWMQWGSPSNVMAGFSDIRGLRSTDGGRSWGFGYTGQTYNSMYQIAAASNGAWYAAVSSVHDLYQSTYLQDSRIDGGQGEVLYSTNQGQVWQRLHNFTNVVFGVTLDPNHTSRLYAAVVHSAKGGFYVSSNIHLGVNATWSKLAASPRTEGHPYHLQVLNDGTLVAVYSGRRTAAGVFTASSGVFVSTNGGASWLDRSSTNFWYWTKDLVVDPYEPGQSNWYVGVFSGWGGAPNGKGGLYRTSDRGLNWTRILNRDRVTSCTFSPLHDQVLWVTTETEGLWMTTNARAAFPSFAADLNYPFRQPERVFVNPHQPREIWVTSFGHGLRRGWLAPDAPVLRWTLPGEFNWASEPHTRYSLWQAAQPDGPYDQLIMGDVYAVSPVNSVTSAPGSDVVGFFRLRAE
jgi:hypothetical protein